MNVTLSDNNLQLRHSYLPLGTRDNVLGIRERRWELGTRYWELGTRYWDKAMGSLGHLLSTRNCVIVLRYWVLQDYLLLSVASLDSLYNSFTIFPPPFSLITC